jgi:hypothetical protein
LADLFGWEINRKKDPAKEIESFAPPMKDDGAVVVQEGGVIGTYLDLEGAVRTESELVTRYREMSIQPEVESAIDDIINEMIAFAEDEDLVEINLDQLDGYSEKVKDRIRQEFEEVVRLYDFNMNGYDLCRRWYIDGRLYFHAIIDEEKPDHGILEMRYIDPRKLRKVREIRRIPQAKGLASTIQVRSEYYIYNDRGFALKETSTTGYQNATGMRIAEDSIVAVTSGLMDPTNQMVLGYLHKAIKPLNQLRAMEDASVIYRLVRAPERRVFYIDVGSLPKLKAEQYLRDMMVKHKNKVVYDAMSGEIRDDRRYATMLEDFWLPRREGGRGTEITTLPGGQNLGQMEDVNYFKQRLYHALQVPVSRLADDGGSFNLGRATEISRDELKFSKFIDRARLRFSSLFYKTLEKQLVLKRVISVQEAPSILQKVKFTFASDNFFAELKETEIMRERLGLLNDIDQYVGKYFSTDYVKRHVLRQDDDAIEKMQAQMDQDEMNGQTGEAAGPNLNAMPGDPSQQGMDGPGLGQADPENSADVMASGGPDGMQQQQMQQQQKSKKPAGGKPKPKSNSRPL